MSSDKKVAIQSFLMPTAGIGCWQSSKGEVGQAIEWAVEAGVKLIDTAYVYMNEAEIGAALDKVLKAGVHNDSPPGSSDRADVVLFRKGQKRRSFHRHQAASVRFDAQGGEALL